MRILFWILYNLFKSCCCWLEPFSNNNKNWSLKSELERVYRVLMGKALVWSSILKLFEEISDIFLFYMSAIVVKWVRSVRMFTKHIFLLLYLMLANIVYKSDNLAEQLNIWILLNIFSIMSSVVYTNEIVEDLY